MNKIYKVVWSKVKNCYVVVSEIAKNVISGSVKSTEVGTAPIAKGMALGAMMAFVITGNVWAANTGEGIVARGEDVLKKGNLTFDITNTPYRYVAIHAHDGGQVEAITLTAIVTGGTFAAGVEANDGSKVSLGDTTLTISDNGEPNSEAYGINVARQGIVNVTGNINATITANAWVTALEAYNGSSIEIGSSDAIVDNVELNVSANGTDNNVNDDEGIRAHGIYACGQSEDVIDKNGNVEENAYGISTINVNAKNLSITSNAANGKAYGIIAEDGGVVNVSGNVSVNAIGNEVYGIEALNGSKVELGEEGKNVSIKASCKGENKKEVIAIAVYAEGEDSKVDILADNLIVEGVKEHDKSDQRRRSLVAKDDAVINITANKADFLGRLVAYADSEINIDASVEFNSNTPFDVSDDSQINLIGGKMSGVLNIINGNVNLTGAIYSPTITYNDNNLINYITGSGMLVLDEVGVLKTVVKDVFSNINTTSAGIDTNTFVGNSKIVYKGGYISLGEDYSYNYLKSALSSMNSYSYDGNQTETTLIMTGNLINYDKDGNVVEENKNKISIDNLNLLNREVVLEKVTVQVGKDLQIGGSVNSSEVASIENSIAVNALDLGAGDKVSIADGKELTLGDKNNNDNIVSCNSGNVKIVVGNDANSTNNDDCKLNIGNDDANKDSKYTLKGSVTVNEGSGLNTKGETTITEGVELNGGKVHVEEGHHLNTDIKAEGKDNIIQGKVTSEKLEAKDKNTKVHLGDKERAGKMHAKESNLNGGMLFLDPEFANDISEASKFTLVVANELDGGYVAGQNSVIALGVSDRDAAEKVFLDTELTFGNDGDVNAVIYLATNTDLKAGLGSITADGTLNSESNYSATAGKLTFADKSLLMVEANKIADTAAISGVTETNISDGAKLYINDAVENGKYKILAGSNIGKVWNDISITTNNKLITFEGKIADDKSAFDVKAKYNGVNNVYGNDVIISTVVEKALVDGGVAAVIFNAAASENINATREAQVDAINGVGYINELAGVSHTTYAVSNILTDAVADHVSLANAEEHNKDIWAHYVHTKEDVAGLKGAGKYSAQYNGIVVGADIYKEGKATVGAALTYVDGNINGSTLASRTENDVKYYGASIYGSIENENSAVIADVSYLHGEHDITQRNSGELIVGKPESDAFSVGVRVEKETKAGIGKLVPYAGMRYMHLGTGNYTNSIGLTYDTEDASLFMLPVGVKYSSEIHNKNGWTVRPIAEVGYVWAFGDTDSNQTVSLNGASNSFGYDVADGGSWIGLVGVQAVKNDWTFGVSYSYQDSDHSESKKWYVDAKYSF